MTPHQLFGPADGEANVVLNLSEDGIGELLPYAMGYRQAAERLWSDLEPRSHGAFADYEIVPVVFLLRHSIEVGLKFAVLMARGIERLAGRETPFDDEVLSRHDLQYLWDQVRGSLRVIRGPKVVNDLDAFGGTVIALHNYDQGSYSFRYPVKRDASLSLPEKFTFSMRSTIPPLVDLAHAIEGLGHELDDQASYAMEEYIDMHGERPREAVVPRLRLRTASGR